MYYEVSQNIIIFLTKLCVLGLCLLKISSQYQKCLRSACSYGSWREDEAEKFSHMKEKK